MQPWHRSTRLVLGRKANKSQSPLKMARFHFAISLDLFLEPDTAEREFLQFFTGEFSEKQPFASVVLL